MSVEQFKPGKALFTMSDTAMAHSRKELKKENAKGMRISTKESGCSGFKYVVDFVFKPEEKDLSFIIEKDITLFVDKESLPLINGTHIDYISEGLNYFFKFTNPNAEGECGCGESFSVN